MECLVVDKKSQSAIDSCAYIDTGECDVLYDGHCVVALLTARLDYKNGQTACEEIGGNLANLYDEEEMTLLEDFLKENKMDDYLRLDLRTGMKFEVRASKLTIHIDKAAGQRLTVSRSASQARTVFPFLTTIQVDLLI